MPKFKIQIVQNRKGDLEIEADDKDAARQVARGMSVQQVEDDTDWVINNMGFGEVKQIG